MASTTGLEGYVMEKLFISGQHKKTGNYMVTSNLTGRKIHWVSVVGLVIVPGDCRSNI